MGQFVIRAKIGNIPDPPLGRPGVGWGGINDSVFIECYTPPRANCAGKQREGIRQTFTDTVSWGRIVKAGIPLATR